MYRKAVADLRFLEGVTWETRRERQCDNYNLTSCRRCNNMSRVNLSGYVVRAAIFS